MGDALPTIDIPEPISKIAAGLCESALSELKNSHHFCVKQVSILLAWLCLVETWSGIFFLTNLYFRAISSNLFSWGISKSNQNADNLDDNRGVGYEGKIYFAPNDSAFSFCCCQLLRLTTSNMCLTVSSIDFVNLNGHFAKDIVCSHEAVAVLLDNNQVYQW